MAKMRLREPVQSCEAPLDRRKLKNCVSARFQQLAEQFSVNGIVFGNEDSAHGCPADFARLRP